MKKFVRAELIPKGAIDHAAVAAKLGNGVTAEDVQKAYAAAMDDEVYINDVYQVAVHRRLEDKPRIIHLSIKRIDKQPIHDWRDLQQIKNELTDPEFDACELYPAESRLVDTANQYHLWVYADKQARIPLGWGTRLVVGEAVVEGSVQRHISG